MDSLIESVEKLSKLKLDSIAETNWIIFFNQIVSLTHEICVNIIKCENNNIQRESILKPLEPIREIYRKSPFGNRLQVWPKGFPGDFETIEYLCDAKNRSEKNTIHYFSEYYALNCPVAQQHRNKIYHQAQQILNQIVGGSRKPSILSLACGGCRDIRSIKNYLVDTPFSLVLNDFDKEALDFSQKELKSLGDKCIYLLGHSVKLINVFQNNGPFNLIIAGGLFDYLPDKHIIFILRNAFNKLLTPGGKFYFTNISENNPYRAWMEYLADWKLIQRSKEHLIQLIRRAEIGQIEFTIKKEETDLTYLVEIVKE